MSEDEKLLKEAKKLPWEDRLTHKNWKVRNDANIDLAAVCDSISDPKDPRLREFGPFFRKTVADSNAPVQEKALDALIAYLKAADADAGRYAKEVCDAIVAKCLTGRPKTVEKAQMVFMLWVELEAVEAFLDAMEKAIKNKVAKAVVPAIDVMFQALSEFGSKIVPPKRILKMLPELFDHQDQNVRASSKGLTLELCRWVGKDPVKSILFEKMRDTMKKELEASLLMKEPEIEAVSEVTASGPAEENAADVPQEIDEYELVDPVDILTPLEKSGFWEGVKATKWSERKDAVAELTKLASTKRIAPGDFTEVCRTLKKLITDVNIAVAVEAIQALGNLARGLRTHFSGNSRFLLPVLLEKLKEKKQTLTDALTQTLQAMHKSGCLNLTDIIEGRIYVKTAVKNKVPLVRSLTLNWVTYCIETSNKAAILKVHKEYVPICMECLNDGTPEVRDAAFSALAAIAKASEGSFVRRSAASMLSGKKPTNVAPAATKKAASAKASTNKKSDGGQSKVSKPVEQEDVEPAEMSLEEIENRLGSLIQAETITQLKSAVWKERLEGISERVADIKTRTQAMKCLTTFCEAVGPGFIFERLYKIMKEHKNPKVLSEGLLWMVTAIEDFGISYIKLKGPTTTLLIDIKAFLSDVKPALLSALDAEYEKNPFEGASAAPKKTVKVSDSTSSLAAGGVDGLPREDISEKIGPTLLKGLESSDWKIRLESIESVNKILEEANRRIQPTGLGLLSDVLKCLGDNKKQMRECTLSTLDSWLAAAHLDKMDKSADVRKAAEACFNEILRVCGHEMVTKNLKDIQGSALAIVVERLKPYGAFQENFETGRSIPAGIASKTSSKIGKSNAHGDRASSSRHGNRVASSRAVPTKGPRQDSIMSVQDINIQSHALLNVKDSNKNDIMKYFREDLHRRLLSTDFKKQVDGIEMLQKALPSIGRELIEVLDILLRWFVLRFCESNTSCLLKVLEFLPELLEMLRNEGYTMTEAEAAIFLPCLIEKISGQLKSLQIVASLTAERDGETRKAALNTLATGYKILGDDIWRFVGKLNEHKEAREMEKRKEGRPGEARAALRRSVRDNGSDPAEQSGEVSRSMTVPILNRENYGHSEVHTDRVPITRAYSGVGPTDWNEALDIIAYGSPEQSVEGMKVVCHELAQATADPEGSTMDDIVAKTFDFSLTGASSRSCKYVLNTLMQAFQNKRLAHAVKESTLDSLITELLLWLLDERVPQMDDGSQLLRALNVLMLKILVLQNTIYDVDLDRILQSIHIYLQELGMDEIRKRAGADDKPLRMVKTVLHELVKLRGTAIKGHLSMVPIDMQPQPIILAYIDLNLQYLWLILDYLVVWFGNF
ncbi:UNVERIFIED_CONTAM: protein MOR1 [Sesamum radiatum]|uniref:Protein MOR1 n=1 Tax=Sesamum radiatum TaxID=300843 RepID=A0AAW2KGE4_SESRA